MPPNERGPRRLSRGPGDPTTPVAMWFLLTALAGQREVLLEHARAFCGEFDNARVVDAGAAGNPAGVHCVYVVVEGGDIAGAVRGGPAASAAVATAKALVDRLFMFYPAIAEEPGGEQSA